MTRITLGSWAIVLTLLAKAPAAQPSPVEFWLARADRDAAAVPVEPPKEMLVQRRSFFADQLETIAPTDKRWAAAMMGFDADARAAASKRQSAEDVPDKAMIDLAVVRTLLGRPYGEYCQCYRPIDF